MANIRCSLCKILPIQIKNLDDYLCEQDHVVCKKCIVLNAQKQLICPLCKSRITKNRKILLETTQDNNHGNNNDIKNRNDIPNHIFSTPNFSDDDNSAVAEETRFWSNQCGILHSPIDSINSYTFQNSENNGTSGMRFHMGDVPSDIYGFDQSAKRCPADENMCFEKNIFLKNDIFDPNIDLIDDTDKIKIGINNQNESCIDNDLNDTMLLFHKTISGKTDPNFDPQKHFYQTMHYLNEKNEIVSRPSLLFVQKSSDQIAEHGVLDTESTLVLKRFAECQRDELYNSQKKIESPMITFTYNTIGNNNIQKNDNISDTVVQTIYERPKHPISSIKKNCTESEQNNHSLLGNINNFLHHEQTNEQPKIIHTQQSTRTILRNQIKEMTYSNIKENDVETATNGKFMSQNSTFKPSPLISLHIDRNGSNDKSTFYSGVIQHHLNKAMEDLILNEQNCRNAKREKRQQIVRQEQETIRKRIKDQIYKTLQDPITTLKNVASCEKPSSGNLKKMDSTTSADKISIVDSKEFQNNISNIQNIFSNKEFRNISLSTESYPKLNPQLHIVSQTLSNFDKKYSKLHEESFDEIKKQFENQAKIELELIASIESKTKQLLNESVSRDTIEEISSSQVVINNNESNCHLMDDISKTKSINIEIKNSQMSEFSENLNTETSAADMKTIHEPPQNRQININKINNVTSKQILSKDIINKISTQTINNKISAKPISNKISAQTINNKISGQTINSKISAQTINNKISGQTITNKISVQTLPNPDITESNMNNTYRIKQIRSTDIISEENIPNFDENLNNKESTEKINEKTENIDINKTLKHFIEVLKIKNPSMTTTDIHEIIKFLPDTTTTEINKEIENLPSIANPTTKSSENLSETLIDEIKISNELSDDESSNLLLSSNNAWRAFYCPPKDYCSEPKPQIRSIKLDKKVILKSEPKYAGKLNIERHPVNCPITSCKRKVFISEFTKHMKVDHTKTYIESITPGECRNLFFDPKVVHHGVNKCHNLYLVTDKIRDLGSREYKNYLPIMLMSTKISLLELICSIRPKDEDIKNCKQYYIVVWLTGLVATEIPIYYTLIVWSRSGEIPKCHIVHSGTLYSFRDEQNAKTLFKKGQAMLLSKDNCDQLTDNGKNMVELQVIVH